jgi:hypothetical protein
MNNKCAPNKKFIEGSCYTLEDLITISKSWNNIHKNNQIKIKNNKKYLLKTLLTRMNSNYNCNNDQICWLNTKVIKNINNNEIKKYTFRPEGPKQQYEWLSTSNINNVMSQYEKKYKNFKFFGAVPYDFEDLPGLEIYNLNLDNVVKNNINKLGLVINLDEHTELGSHWVSLYTDLNKNQIYFFDSFSNSPGDRIKRLSTKILTYMYNKKYNKNLTTKEFVKLDHSHGKIDKDFDVRYNKLQHQFKNSECGVYSMNFIIRLLNGETFNQITENITKDDKMNSCRKSYFRK